MSRLFTAGIILLSLAACAQTKTFPTPEPLKIQDGQLLVYDEHSGVYDVIGDGVAAVSQSDDGAWVARDDEGNEVFRFNVEENVWEEVTEKPTEQVLEPTFIPERPVESILAQESMTGVQAVNPPSEFQASGGEITGLTGEQIEGRKYWEVLKLWKVENGMTGSDKKEFFGTDDYYAKMDEFMASHPDWQVFQNQDPVTGEVLTYVGDKDGKSVQWAVTSEGALADVVPGDNTELFSRFIKIEVSNPENRLAFNRGEDGYWYMAEITPENVAVRWFVAVGGTEDNIEEQWKEVEAKVDPNYGYIAPKTWGEESLPLVREWWDGYKEKMPTNEDVKWLTYEDGSKVELGEISGLRYGVSRTFGFILADMFDFPDSIDPQNFEQMILALAPTNPDKIEEAGNILPIRLTTKPSTSNWTVGLRIIGENGAVRESLNWNSLDIAKGLTHGELIRFMRMGLEGDNPPFYGCQLAVSLAGSDSEKYAEGEHIQSIYGEKGDGEWKVDNGLDWVALNPQGAGMFAIPESCMTDEMWEVFRTLK